MPATETAPASASFESGREENAGTSRPSISVCVALPPAPWAIVIWLSRKRSGLARTVSMISRTRCSRSVGAAWWANSDDLTLAGEAPVVVVGGAGPLGRDHARPDRVLGRARAPEHLALPGLDHALQDLAALAGLRVGDADAGHLVANLGVEAAVGLGQLQCALRDEPEAPPLEMRSQLEHLGQNGQRGPVPVVGDDPGVLVF